MASAQYLAAGMPAPVDPAELVGAAEIAERFGVRRETIHLWRRRHEDFPAPVAELDMGLVWSWPEIEAWGRATGRLT